MKMEAASVAFHVPSRWYWLPVQKENDSDKVNTLSGMFMSLWCVWVQFTLWN
jgi:hypothetical protein